jgi:putative NADH-flavin reductase
MHLFIIGANGRTGTQLIELGLQRGHELTAFVRSPQKISTRHERLRVVQGDPARSDELAAALPGHDAVFSALGIQLRELFRPVTLLQTCAASTVAAMSRAGVRRLALVSAATLFAQRDLKFALARFVLANQIRDLERTEQIIGATDLEWTIARPPKLEASPVETYRAQAGGLPTGAWAISFRAVAAFLLDAVEQRAHLLEVVGLAA